MNTEPFVFISYSTKNQDYAEAARKLLIEEGIRCWMAPYDIPPGSKYAEVINDAIKNCHCMLLLLTEAAQESNFVYREVGRAVGNGKTIITMRLENTTLDSKFEFYIGEEQIVQVKHMDKNDSEVVRALESIKTYLKHSEDVADSDADEEVQDEKVREILEEIQKEEENDIEWEFELENNSATDKEDGQGARGSFLDRLNDLYADSDFEDFDDEPAKSKPKGLIACGVILLLFAMVTFYIAKNNLYLWQIVESLEFFGYESSYLYSRVLAGFCALHSVLLFLGVVGAVRLMRQKLYIRSVAMIIIMGLFTVMNFNNAAVVASRGKCTNQISIGYCTESVHNEILQRDGHLSDFITIERADEPIMVDGEFYYMDYLVLTRNYAEEWEEVTKGMNLPEDTFAIYLPKGNMRRAAVFGE